MTAFIKFNNRFYSLASVVEISAPIRDEVTVMIGHDAPISASAEVLETLVEITPAPGDWEVVRLIDDEDDMINVFIEPVLAWGRRLDGEVVPVTPMETKGVPDHHLGFRRQGESHVHAGGEIWSDADTWRDWVVFQRREAS